MFTKLTKANHYKDLSNLPTIGRLDNEMTNLVGCAYYSSWAVDLRCESLSIYFHYTTIFPLSADLLIYPPVETN